MDALARRTVRTCERQGTCARGVEALGLERLGVAGESQKRPVAELGARVARENLLDDRADRWPDRERPREHSFRRPLAVVGVTLRLVRVERDERAFPCVAPYVRCDALSAKKNLDRRGCCTHLHASADERARNTIETVFELNMVVDMYFAFLPIGWLIATTRQGLERRPVELRERGATAPIELLERFSVERFEVLGDRGIQLVEAEERAVPKAREDPPLGDQDTAFDFALSRGFAGRAGITAKP